MAVYQASFHTFICKTVFSCDEPTIRTFFHLSVHQLVSNAFWPSRSDYCRVYGLVRTFSPLLDASSHLNIEKTLLSGQWCVLRLWKLSMCMRIIQKAFSSILSKSITDLPGVRRAMAYFCKVPFSHFLQMWQTNERFDGLADQPTFEDISNKAHKANDVSSCW